MTKEQAVVAKFQVKNEQYAISPYGDGHINDTFLVEGSEKYILQRINHNIFKDVDGLMANISAVCAHQLEMVKKAGGDTSKCLTVIPTLDGKTYYKTEDGNYYRMFDFIKNTVSINIPLSAEHFGEGGKCFARFMKSLIDFDASTLTDTIPNFHDTEKRFMKLVSAVEKDEFNRKAEVQELIDFAYAREEDCKRVVRLIEKGEIPLRVTHNDTKFNNLLFDEQTKAPVSVIDLDTIMKGSVLYDFGDAVRIGCNPVAEDEHDLSLVQFNLPFYKVFVKSYVEVLDGLLTKAEIDNLAFSCRLLTLECGIRFLTDYLEGDVYFKTHYDKQNVYRCKTQFKLVSDMEKVFKEMEEAVRA